MAGIMWQLFWLGFMLGTAVGVALTITMVWLTDKRITSDDLPKSEK